MSSGAIYPLIPVASQLSVIFALGLPSGNCSAKRYCWLNHSSFHVPIIGIRLRVYVVQPRIGIISWAV